MIDWNTETLITLNAAAKLIPPRRAGRPRERFSVFFGGALQVAEGYGWKRSNAGGLA